MAKMPLTAKGTSCFNGIWGSAPGVTLNLKGMTTMVKAAFAGTGSFEVYHRVYAENSREILFSQLEFMEELVTKENIVNLKSSLFDVCYLFSSWGMPAFTEAEIKEYLPNLKAVFYGAGSVQGFARPFLNSGVKVFSSWAANAIPVAEYSVAQIILANKGFFQASMKFKSGGKEFASEYFRKFKGNFGATLGILGAGMIGKEVIRLLKPYRLDILVFDPFLPSQAAEELGVRLASLDEIFSCCDVISNHLANNEQTQKMINYTHFSKMKDNVTFINTGRGAQLVESDLVRVLKEKPDATAILDVTFPEPPEEGHEFYSLENVILTPHIAGSAGDEVARMGEFMVQEYLAFEAGAPCSYEVTLKMLETMA